MGRIVTPVGATQIDTAQSKFGGASGLFDGTADYLTLADSTDWNLGTSDFTIDLWARFSALSNAHFWMQGAGTTYIRFWYDNVGHTIGFGELDGAWQVLFQGSWSPSINTWYHLEVVRSGTTTWKMFINGTAITFSLVSGSASRSIATKSQPAYIGADVDGGEALNGWIDEFRFSNGIARHTSDFTPPTEEYTGPNSLSLSASPSVSLSTSPSKSLSTSPSVSPSISPPNSFSPSISVSISPSVSPPQSESPSISPSISSSLSPSSSSSLSPSLSPSISSSLSPSASASMSPSVSPSVSPSITAYEGLKTRFLTYLNSCLRLNGINKPKAFNGTSWITTGGVFDLDNIPQASKYAIEFKDRVYVAGKSDSPDQVDISSIANAQTRTVSWLPADGAKFIVFEQEDGGGGITGLWKVPGYVIVGKKRTLKRYDGSSAYPEDMVNQGIPTQECGVTSQGMLFFVNENGAWATEGGKPKKISTYTVDKIIKSCSDFMWVASGTDEEHVFFSFPSVTISGETYTNVVLKYNIFQNTWDVRKYPTHHTCYTKYVDDDGIFFVVLGDNDGSVRKLDTGNSDDGIGITYSMETQDIDFGMRLYLKRINQLGVLTDNVSKGMLMWRKTHQASDWRELGTIDKEVNDFDQIDLLGNYFNFKITETVSTGQAKIIGLEFPAGIEVNESSSN
jgi:hypothetical protein